MQPFALQWGRTRSLLQDVLIGDSLGLIIVQKLYPDVAKKDHREESPTATVSSPSYGLQLVL